MTGIYIGIDTSCYTTSVAAYSAEGVLFDVRKLLTVEHGQRGLRQSDGLYQHIRQLPELAEQVLSSLPQEAVKGIGCSTSPTNAPGSYMPVFLAGSGAARMLAAAYQVPLYSFHHQAGHIRAALIGNERLMCEESFFALHISGGTTDLLRVKAGKGLADIACIGSSSDLHAGQLIDRVGVALGCPFPAGPSLERLALAATSKNIKIPSSVTGLRCSLSGAESALQRCIGIAKPEEIAFAAYDVLSRTIAKLLRNAFSDFGEKKVLLCGGVASSGLLRDLLQKRTDAMLFWGDRKLSSDNAVGIAALACDLGEKQTC